MTNATDQKARELAVDPERSVLVQAPAGSGKTTLLVQRVLRLLGRVDNPEEVLAITFTRKAAASMRERILRYLRMEERPEEAHEVATWEDAQALRGKAEAWGLNENPSRLRVMTIDAFCTMLARQMPVLSGLGKMPQLSEYPLAAYREAASRALSALDEDGAFADDVAALLAWRDNDLQSIEDLLVALLPVREKWLRVLGGASVPDRGDLERVLRDLVDDELAVAAESLRQAIVEAGSTESGFAGLIDFAAHAVKPDSKVAACKGLTALPDASADCLDQWAGVAELLLTAKGEARKKVTKNDGFPAKTPEKEAMARLLEALGSIDGRWCAGLHAARQLPAPEYADDEWHAQAAMIRVLQRCAAELEVVFAELGIMDFSGVAAAALRGLGSPDAPTDLALYLDHAISHILMDECQDSNWGQFHLLERLTSGWEPGDGRTLFMVGDPMQSIYRFREADVGLFVRARDEGIGGVKLEFAQLTRNFRSRTEIVDWVNSSIGPSFPAQDDQIMGQVRYADSVPALSGGGEVCLEIASERSRVEEARVLADHIERALQTENSDYEIAVLVRARPHLNELLPELRRRGIDFSSLQLDLLLDRPVVQDLYALTRAIWHPADRAAWLAVLRAPWCGLALGDLLAIARHTPKGSLWPALTDTKLLESLDSPTQERITRVVGVIERVHEHQGRLPVRDVVEGAWRALGGRHLNADAGALRDAYRFLSVVDAFDEAGRITDWGALQDALEKQRSEGSHEKAQVQVLTIHESKGLEFDMVVLPGLDRRPKVPDQQLLEWLPLGGEHSENLILAPLRPARESKPSALVGLIRRFEDEMASAERKRLLYVAATRAKKRLVVSASTAMTDAGPACGNATSMLSDLWPAVAPHVKPDGSAHGQTVSQLPDLDQALVRVTDGWTVPAPDPAAWQPAFSPKDPDVEIRYDWASARVRQFGRVMHRLLELIGRDGVETFHDERLAELKARIPLLLQREGIGRSADIKSGTTRMVKALDNVLSDPTGRWLLEGHEEAACELPISGVIDGEPVSVIIDRTFVANGERWIVDWKGGRHAGGSLDAFLEAEAERHSAQVRRYARLVSGFDDRPIRMGLYLPMHRHWIEISQRSKAA